MFIIAGAIMTKHQVTELEQSLKVNPDQLLVRLKLLSYYSIRLKSTEMRQARLAHLLWLVTNKPDLRPTSNLFATVSIKSDEDSYIALRKEWLRQVDLNPQNAKIIGNAARFFLQDQPNLAEELLLRARDLEPNNPRWSEELGQFYSLERHSDPQEAKARAQKALKHNEKALKQAHSELRRFYALNALVQSALDAEEWPRATTAARELLNLAKKFPTDWNFGNAVFDGNIALGKIALKQGEIEKSKSFLIKASETPGSPQLNSFGPSYDLAGDLLGRGETEAVKIYLRNCAKFWSMDNGLSDRWIKEIEAGKVPDFNKFEFQKMSITKIVRNAFRVLRLKLRTIKDPPKY